MIQLTISNIIIFYELFLWAHRIPSSHEKKNISNWSKCGPLGFSIKYIFNNNKWRTQIICRAWGSNQRYFTYSSYKVNFDHLTTWQKN